MGVTKEDEDDDLPNNCNFIVEKSLEIKTPTSPHRKPRHRPKHHCPPLEKPKSAGHKSGGHKRTRRYENTCFLLSLVDEEEFGELTINDFVESSQSVFEQLLADRDSLEIWNDFMNRPGEEQELFLQQLACKEPRQPEQQTIVSNEDNSKDENLEESGEHGAIDKRTVHPAHTPKDSFLRISSQLRAMLRRKHLPKGMVRNHEDNLVPWFTEDPGSVFISHINCSFDRLLLHAVCQYLDLNSTSYDNDGQRQTKVENSQDWFNPPPLLLSEYLDTLKIR